MDLGFSLGYRRVRKVTPAVVTARTGLQYYLLAQRVHLNLHHMESTSSSPYLKDTHYY